MGWRALGASHELARRVDTFRAPNDNQGMRASLLLFFATSIVGCTAPKWSHESPRLQREAAYDWLVIAPGDAHAERREEACDQARERAFTDVRALFIGTYKDQSDIVAAAGGPARVERVLEAFANEVGRVSAQTTALFYDDALRHCYLELSWFLPQPLAQAVRRNVESLTTEEGVGLEMSRALTQDDPRGPVTTSKSPMKKGSVNDAISAIYPGWYVRFVQVPECPERRLAFVGAPGGTESRWLWLAVEEGGFRIAKDERLQGDTWPTPPEDDCRSLPVP